MKINIQERHYARSRFSRSTYVFATLFLVMVLNSTSVNAALLNPVLDFPKIRTFAFIVYSADSNVLFLDLMYGTIEFGPDESERIISPNGGIFAEVDENGNLINGRIDLGGEVPSLPGSSGQLLNGELVAFGFSEPSEAGRMDFLFVPTGGEAADLFGSRGALITNAFEFNGSFDVSFNTGGGGVVARVIPVPAAAWLFVSGLIGLIGVARRKKA